VIPSGSVHGEEWAPVHGLVRVTGKGQNVHGWHCAGVFGAAPTPISDALIVASGEGNRRRWLCWRVRVRPGPRSVIGVIGQQADEVCTEFAGTRIRPPLRVPMCRRRGGVAVRDQHYGIPAGLVDLISQVVVVEARLRFSKDP
jgi:hypothetical protein